MSDFTADEVLEALGLHLAALEIVRHSVVEPYGADDPDLPAFFDGSLPPDPDTVLAAAILDDRRDREESPDIDVRIRFRCAGESVRPVEKFGDRVFEALHVPDHAYRPQMWPGNLRVLDVRRVVRAKSTQDSNGRWMRADDYRFTILNQGAPA